MGLPENGPMTTDAHVPVVQAERSALSDSLLTLGPDAPTLCDPWRARDLAAHLVLREHRPFLATGIWFAPLHDRMERGQASIAAQGYPALVEQVRSGPPWWAPTRLDAVDAVLNTTELVIHHEDVLRGDGRPGPRREVPARTGRAVMVALKRSASLMFRRAGVQVRLVAPGAEPGTAGRGDSTITVTGDPVELLLLASGRMRVAAVELEGSPAAVETLRSARLGV